MVLGNTLFGTVAFFGVLIANAATAISCGENNYTPLYVVADGGADRIPCVDTLSACEFVSNRETSNLLRSLHLFDCAYDYGTCLPSEFGLGVECETACVITYSASSCNDGCVIASGL